MSYLVLARKWRPRVFDDFIGQPHIVKVLKNTLSQKRVHHAYVFSGPRGVGKTTTARILAKSLNCIKGLTPEPCGICEFCLSITDGSSLDVIEIDGASNNSVDDIREIRERVRYAPSVAGKYKVYIIDEAHMLSESAFNALLKTIEEPPPHTIFVLATTAYRKIPLTVLSRCQHLVFRRIPRDMIIERLRYICHMEGISITDEGLELLAKAADGSMRDALTLLDQVSSFTDKITASDVADLFGVSDSRMVSDISDAIFSGDQKRILSLIAEATRDGADLRILFKDLLIFLRDMLVYKTIEVIGEKSGSGSMAGLKSFFDFSQDDLEQLERLSDKVSQEELVLILNELLKVEPEIRNATFPRVSLEVNLIKVSFFKEFTSLKDAIEKLKTFGGESSRVRLLPSSEPLPEKKRPETQIDAPPRSIEEFLRFMDEKDHILASKLMHAEISIEGNTIHFLFNGGHSFLAKSILEEKGFLQRALEDFFGRSLNIKISSSEKTKASLTHEKGSLDNFKQEVLSRPEVREIIELFEGSVIEVKKLNGNN